MFKKRFLVFALILSITLGLVQPAKVSAAVVHDREGGLINWVIDSSKGVVNNVLDLILGSKVITPSDTNANNVIKSIENSNLGKPIDYYSNNNSPVNSTVNSQNVSTYTWDKFNSDNTINNSYTTNTYKMFENHSTSTSNNFQFYNPVTNNYDYTNNFKIHQDTTYNTTTYYYDTYNIDNSVKTTNYITDYSNHVTHYYITQDLASGVRSDLIVHDLYFQLPDGSSSSRLKASEVKGKYLIYDYANYEYVAEDDGTLGLWHFDENLTDSSYYHNEPYISQTPYYTDSIENFGYALRVNNPSKFGVYLPESFTSFENTTIEFNILSCSDDFNCFADSINTIGSYAICINSSTASSDFSYLLQGDIYKDGIFLSSLYKYIYDTSIYTFTTTNVCFNSVTHLFYNLFSGTSFVIDELRISNRILYDSNYILRNTPFDTNLALALPDNPREGFIYFNSADKVSNLRVGGVRPSYPTKGTTYISLDDNDKVTSVQQFTDNNWHSISALIYSSGQWIELMDFDMTTYTLSDPANITIKLPEVVTSRPDYGLSINDLYNWYDPDTKIYHKRVDKFVLNDYTFRTYNSNILYFELPSSFVPGGETYLFNGHVKSFLLFNAPSNYTSASSAISYFLSNGGSYYNGINLVKIVYRRQITSTTYSTAYTYLFCYRVGSGSINVQTFTNTYGNMPVLYQCVSQDINLSSQVGNDPVVIVPDVPSTPGGGSGSGGSGSGDSGSGGGGIFDWIGDAVGGIASLLGSIISAIVEVLTSLLGPLVEAIGSMVGLLGNLLDGILEGLTSLTDFTGGFTSFLGSMFGFIPNEFWNILSLGLSLLFAAAFFKIIRG